LPKITILIGFSFVELSTVDSTNNYAMAAVHEGMASHGMAIFAHDQTAGKGQRGKAWATEPGSNLILSVIVDASPIRHLHPFALSVATALAAFDLFSHHAVSDTSIKWPNDIYWRDRKAGGILIENVYRGKEWQWSVLGVGVNVNQTAFPDLLRPPVSLKQITGSSFDTIALARELCVHLESRWQALLAGQGFLAEYQVHLFGRGRGVRLRQGSSFLDTEIIGVLPDGRLETTYDGGTCFSVGDVEWVW
jgi:BirA family transcriptional regulator, biotin operon repressor / biotin---[acetyl-CoA-carboxylase] ligase